MWPCWHRKSEYHQRKVLAMLFRLWPAVYKKRWWALVFSNSAAVWHCSTCLPARPVLGDLLPAQICDVPERLLSLVQPTSNCVPCCLFIHMDTSQGRPWADKTWLQGPGSKCWGSGGAQAVLPSPLPVRRKAQLGASGRWVPGCAGASGRRVPGCAADVARKEAASSGWCLVGSHLTEGQRTWNPGDQRGKKI